VTASVGYATDDPSAVLSAADTALYRTKQARRHLHVAETEPDRSRSLGDPNVSGGVGGLAARATEADFIDRPSIRDAHVGFQRLRELVKQLAPFALEDGWEVAERLAGVDLIDSGQRLAALPGPGRVPGESQR